MTVYEALRAMVMAEGISASERIAESRLAEQLGVSRTPVREALQRLEGEGLVIAQGRGIRVRVLSAEELVELYSARAGLEGWAAHRAAERVRDGEIAPARLDRLEKLAADTHALTVSRDLARAVESNRAFHEEVAALADNSIVSDTLAHWWDRIVVSTRRSLHPPERTAAVHAEHEEILRALLSGDAPAARAAVEAHALATRTAVTESRTTTRTTP